MATSGVGTTNRNVNIMYPDGVVGNHRYLGTDTNDNSTYVDNRAGAQPVSSTGDGRITSYNTGSYYMPGLDETTSRVWDPFQIFNSQGTNFSTISGSSKLSGTQNQSMDTLLNYLNNAAGQDQSYKGQLTAGINPIQLSSISDLMNYQSPNAGLSSDITSVLSNIIKSGNRDALTNQFVENIEKPLTSTYQNVTMPQMASTFASKGLSFGTDKQTATNSASATLMDALAKGRADIEAKVVENQLAGIGKANETSAQSLSEILGLTTAKQTAGKTVQDTQQTDLTNQYNQWLRNQPGSNPAIESIIKLLGIDTMYDQQVVAPNSDSGGGIMGLIGSIF